MSLHYEFHHHINGVQIAFQGDATTANDAMETIRAIITAQIATSTAEQKPATTKNKPAAATSTPAKSETENRSTEEQTQTASDNSANSSTATLATPTAETATEATKLAAESTLDYEKDVKPLVLQISKNSRALAEALLQRHGAIDKASGQPSAKALKPDQWPKFVKDAKDVLDGKLDPTKSTEEAIA